MNTTAIITSRLASTRLPGKALIKIHGYPLLWYVVQRLKRCRNLDNIAVATTIKDIEIAEWCSQNDIDCFMGSENDILDRLYNAAIKFSSDVILRVWGSCPLLDSDLADKMIAIEGHDYIYNKGFPKGQELAVLIFAKLQNDQEALKDKEIRHWYHKYCTEQPTAFVVNNYKDMSHINWEVDTPEDLENIKAILSPSIIKVGKKRFAGLYRFGQLEIMDENDDFYTVLVKS